MATHEATITIDDDYVVPEAPLTVEQYVNFVANMACESYMKQYGTVDKLSGLDAALARYNADNTPVEPDAA